MCTRLALRNHVRWGRLAEIPAQRGPSPSKLCFGLQAKHFSYCTVESCTFPIIVAQSLRLHIRNTIAGPPVQVFGDYRSSNRWKTEVCMSNSREQSSADRAVFLADCFERYVVEMGYESDLALPNAWGWRLGILGARKALTTVIGKPEGQMHAWLKETRRGQNENIQIYWRVPSATKHTRACRFCEDASHAKHHGPPTLLLTTAVMNRSRSVNSTPSSLVPQLLHLTQWRPFSCRSVRSTCIL